MAYFVGRDVDIAITTEHPTQGIVVREPISTAGGAPALINQHIAIAVDFLHASSAHADVKYDATNDKAVLFAGPKAMSFDLGCDENEGFGDLGGSGSEPLQTQNLVDSQAWNNQPSNLTGLELSLGVMDEDVAFIGQRNILKAEIKKDNSVTLTRKKSDRVWDGIFNDARFGIKESNSMAVPTDAIPLPGLFTGLSAPDFVTCGYRVVLRFAEAPAIATTAINQGGGIPSGDTAMTFDSSTGMVAGDYIEVGGPASVHATSGGTVNEHEIIKIGAVSGGGTTITGCTRGARGTEAFSIADDDQVTVRGQGTGEVIVLRNCYVTEHAVTLTADGSQEESLTLQSYTDPKIYDGITGGQWDDATTSAEL